MDSTIDDVLPERLLAYVYHPRSFATFSLSEAAKGLCGLLWIVDTSTEEQASMARLLRKLGTVVDIAGLGMDDAAEAIAHHEPDGILTLADDNLRLCAELAVRLGRTFFSPETATLLTDKYLQRAAFERAGLRVPRHWVVSSTDSPASLSTIEREVKFPAVCKPRRGEASRDTVLVNSPEALGDLIEGHLAHGDRDFVIEEYIPDARAGIAGEGFAGYVSVESFVVDGEVVNLAINGRTPQAFPFRETGFFIPSALDDHLGRAVLDVATKAVRSMNATTGCFHTEIKLTPDGPVVIEVNGRIGGGVPEMLSAATGVDVLKISMSLALGDHVVTSDMPPTSCVAFLFYAQAPAQMRYILDVEGLEELRTIDGVQEVILNRGPGRSVDWREGNHGHVFSVFGTTSNHEELRAIDQTIRSIVRISGE